MNQGLTYEVNMVMPQAGLTGLFDSLCTIQARTNAVDPASGQVDLSDWVNVAGLVNIPCQVAPMSSLRPDPAGVHRLPTEFDTLGYRHVLLNDYYPAVLQQHRLMLDGIAFEIMSVERDSQYQQTRMAVRYFTL